MKDYPVLGFPPVTHCDAFGCGREVTAAKSSHGWLAIGTLDFCPLHSQPVHDAIEALTSSPPSENGTRVITMPNGAPQRPRVCVRCGDALVAVAYPCPDKKPGCAVLHQGLECPTHGRDSHKPTAPLRLIPSPTKE